MADLNYFARHEQSLQAGFRARRDRAIAPLTQLCLRIGITADVVSAAAAAMLVLFGIGLFHAAAPWGGPLAVAGLVLHVLLDGLDGPLARSAGTDGPAGSFTDMCLDHTGFLVIVTLLAFRDWLPDGLACAYASSYTLAIIMVVALNLLERPFSWVLRTKYPFFLLVVVALLGGPSYLAWAAVGFSLMHAAYAVIGFLLVRRALREAGQHARPET